MTTETYNWNELLSKIVEEPEYFENVELKTDVKAYSFVNSYLHEKQYGIQTAHALARLVWLDKSKTVGDYMRGSQKLIMLNGGGARHMKKMMLGVCGINTNNFSVDWFHDEDINLHSPSSIVVIPSRKIQHIINEIRSNRKGKVRVSGNLLLNSDGQFILKSKDNGLNQNELELIEKIVNGRTV